jgi:hypothetical protein
MYAHAMVVHVTEIVLSRWMVLVGGKLEVKARPLKVLGRPSISSFKHMSCQSISLPHIPIMVCVG